MLFNSYEFLFGFLPLTLLGFFLIGRRSPFAAACWLGAASLFFYGWWSPKALPLLVGSVVFNYAVGHGLATGRRPVWLSSRQWLTVGIAANLLVLGFFKYANFFIHTVNGGLRLSHLQPLPDVHVLLPIGISFYTFTQIAFLVDCHKGHVKERQFAHYLLFVTYFPHLIAGPVLHHAQMMPQFEERRTYRIDATKVATGLCLLAIGLGKKLLIADANGVHANAMFDWVVPRPMLQSWSGVLAYAFQIYFDFSGYSDMALGLSLLFGIRLPLNFNSPYRATSIIDFWRRWHMSLSTFLRDYLYIPLGGGRSGAWRRHVNLMTTMVLGGLWHGASWTFVLWGAAHGVYLLINHAWRATPFARLTREHPAGVLLSWALTFIAVCLAWVLFRAGSLHDARVIYHGLLGLNGWGAPLSPPTVFYLVLGAAATLVPWHSMRIAEWIVQGAVVRPALQFGAAAVAGALLCLSVLRISGHDSPQFLYFQF